jgi:plastocyanin
MRCANNGTVSTGTSANAKTEGFLIWKVPHFATASTGTYRYICTSHSSMVGSITIKTLEQLS